jgi:hypothetical protein
VRKQTLKHAVLDDSFIRISPIKNIIPEWYKAAPRFTEGNAPRFLPSKNLAMKYCMPFLDGLTSGYYIPLNQDVLVEQRPDGPFLSWGIGSPLEVRSSRAALTLPIPEGHASTHFTWTTQVSFQLPKEYSALVTHPLNRFDLPFTTLSAVIDCDMPISTGNLPFFVKKEFSGLIPRGTPIAQIIPFLREDWSSEEDPTLSTRAKNEQTRSLSMLTGWYKQNRWHKKKYE